VRDRLADHVVHRHERPVRAQSGAHRGSHPLRVHQERGHEFLRQVEQGGDVADRTDQKVSFEHWTVIEERDHLRGSQNDLRGQFPGDDPADDVSHNWIVTGPTDTPIRP